MKHFLSTLILFASAGYSFAQQTFSTQFVRFTPDGKQFIFSAVEYSSNNRINGRIAIMNIDGTGLRYITTATPGKEDAQAVLSKDGKKIVFKRGDVSNTAKGDIFVINTDGTGLKQLSSRSENEVNPEFTPDGKGVVFVREYFKDPGHPIEGELVEVDIATGKEKILIPKEMRVVQAIPLHIGRGGYLIACAETDATGKPLETGGMLVMASPDGEIAPKTKTILTEGKSKIEIKEMIAVQTKQPVFYIKGQEGSGWFGDKVYYNITLPNVVTKETKGPFYYGASLSPDGKMAAYGQPYQTTVKVWDVVDGQFINERSAYPKK